MPELRTKVIENAQNEHFLYYPKLCSPLGYLILIICMIRETVFLINQIPVFLSFIAGL